MNHSILEKLSQIASNRYEAVMLAAKTARKLNQNRKRVEEGIEISDEELPSHRVTGAALAELASGRVEFTRP